jgi:rhamnosyltransferase
MNQNSVCAVVVTFRPDESVLGNLAKVRQQVEGLVVVDNGSSAEALALLRRESVNLGFTLIENGTNLGIASALNIGVRWARKHSYKWVALFDQDSTATDGMISAMLEEYARCPHPEEVAIITPQHVNRTTGASQHLTLDRNGDLVTAITSGSLIPLDVFEQCGLFEDELIIDAVDDEFCLRVRALGYKIYLAPQAKLLHVVGNPKRYSFCGLKFTSSRHSIARRYYITRNSLILVSRYWRGEPRWCLGILRYVVKKIAISMLADNNRAKNARYTVRAIIDGLMRKTGKLVEL